MLVSVIIPTYNRASLLKISVASVLKQTYRPIQCIVVDDGSTDNTSEIVKELRIETDESFQLEYIYQENSGSQVARNRGTAAAKGSFVQYLDSDDILYPNKLVTQVHYLVIHPECDIVYGDWDKGTEFTSEKVGTAVGENMIEQILTVQPIHTFAMLFRAATVKKTGDWDIHLKRNQEVDFQLRALLSGASIGYLEGRTGLWRIHKGERIGNRTPLNAVTHFYKKWEKTLKEHQRWNVAIQKGFVQNYLWFLNEHNQHHSEEITQVLHEIKRLQPGNPIFHSTKYKLVKSLFGENAAMKAWAVRYQKTRNNSVGG